MKRIIVTMLIIVGLPTHADIVTKVCQAHIISAMGDKPLEIIHDVPEPVLVSDNGSSFQMVYNDKVAFSGEMTEIEKGIYRSVVDGTIYIKRGETYQFSTDVGDTWAYMNKCKEVK
jgi:hypothetical protein